MKKQNVKPKVEINLENITIVIKSMFLKKSLWAIKQTWVNAAKYAIANTSQKFSILRLNWGSEKPNMPRPMAER